MASKMIEKIRALKELKNDIEALTDEQHEKEIADSLFDIIEVIAERKKIRIVKTLIKLARRLLDVPDFPDID